MAEGANLNASGQAIAQAVISQAGYGMPNYNYRPPASAGRSRGRLFQFFSPPDPPKDMKVDFNFPRITSLIDSTPGTATPPLTGGQMRPGDGFDPPPIPSDTTIPDPESPPIADPPAATELANPLAASLISLLQKEMVNGIRTRKIEDKFLRFRNYTMARMRATSAFRTGSELAGNCRLDWYLHLLKNPLSAPAEAEEFTRRLHDYLTQDALGLGQSLRIARAKLDLPDVTLVNLGRVDSPEAALEIIRAALADARIAHAKSISGFSKAELSTLTTSLVPIFATQNNVGHTLRSRSQGRRLIDLLEKMDRDAMLKAAEALLPLTDTALLEQLAAMPDGDSTQTPAGPIVDKIDTPSGAILIGGRGNNVYDIDRLTDTAVIIDLGGNDTYINGTVSLQRPVLVIIDLSGDDQYRGNKSGIQGSAVLGVSMLLDLSGNDTYMAMDIAQGATIGGVGILIDYAGDDSYKAVRRAQGHAIAGVGILIDRAGNDRYKAALWAQGMGGPLGMGILEDSAGRDHYYCGGLYLNSYLNDDNPTPGYEGWGQGVGGGIRGVANGGIGVILDGGGDDIYESDYLSHGGGYWCGVGFARDFGGNDQRLGSTRLAFNGGPRTQPRYVRFTTGFGCHYSLGFCFDDRGNDTYNGQIMCLGFAWDCAVGYLCDFEGDDKYSGTEGCGAQAGLGVLFDYVGDDYYRGTRMAIASRGISYHPLPLCGGNFSFVVDYGGADRYGCGAKNNSYTARGSTGGFLIDRPQKGEATTAATSTGTRTP